MGLIATMIHVGRQLLGVTFMLALASCTRESATVVPPTPAEVCAAPGPWGVAGVAQDAPVALPSEPMTRGRAAGHGAYEAGTGTLMGSADVAVREHDLLGSAVIMAVGIVLAPVAAVVGGVVGVVKGNDPDEIAAASAAIRKAALDAQTGEEIRDALLARAETLGRPLVDCPASGAAAACRRGDGTAVSTLLLVSAGPPSFEVEGEIDPDLRLLLSAEVSVLRQGEGERIYTRAWVYRGPLTSYFALARDDAANLRAQLAAAERAIAAKIAADLLQGGNIEVHPTSQQPEGSVWTVLPPGMPQADLGACEGVNVAELPISSQEPAVPAP